MYAKDNANGTITIEKICPWCENQSMVTVSSLGFERWQAGTHVQHAFPELTANQREILISGTHGRCYDQMFPDDGEEM